MKIFTIKKHHYFYRFLFVSCISVRNTFPYAWVLYISFPTFITKKNLAVKNSTLTHLAIFGKTKITLNVISHNVSVFTVIPLYCVWWHTRNSYWFRPSEHNSVVGWNTRFESRYCLSADGSNPVSILLFSNCVYNLVPSWRSTPQCFFQFAHEKNSTCVDTQKWKWIFIFLNFPLKLEIFKFLLYL